MKKMTEKEQDELYEKDPTFRALVDMFRHYLNRQDQLLINALYGREEPKP